MIDRIAVAVYDPKSDLLKTIIYSSREGASPSLSGEIGEAGSKSLVLIVDDPDAPDPDAPKRTWVHRDHKGGTEREMRKRNRLFYERSEIRGDVLILSGKWECEGEPIERIDGDIGV